MKLTDLVSDEDRKKHRAIQRIGKRVGLLGTKIETLSHVIESIDFGAILSMQKQMEAEAISEITDAMVESVMEKTMMDYDAAKSLLVAARLDELWKEDNEGE